MLSYYGHQIKTQFNFVLQYNILCNLGYDSRYSSDSELILRMRKKVPNCECVIFIAGVVIMAVLKRTLKYDCVILVKQYRPPMKACTLEFPAGKA